MKTDQQIKLESEIATFVNADNKNNCTLHFDYSTDSTAKGTFNNPLHVVSAFTFNPISQETFLLKQESSVNSAEDALKKILEYVKNQRGMNSFTVTWKKHGGDGQTQTSHFYCHDMRDVVEKFYFGKLPTSYVVYEIKMNAIS